MLRYVDNLNQRGPLVPSYLSLDLRLGWQPTPNWEFAIIGQNLLDKQHAEFGAPATRQEILLAWIRHRKEFESLVVIVLTSCNDSRATEAGARAFKWQWLEYES